MTWCLWAIAAFWAAMALAHLWAVCAVPDVPPLPADAPGADTPPPRVSVLLSARDEALRLEESLLRLLEQRGIDLEVIAVDDRSQDRTGEILDRLAARDARVQVEHVRELPPGWLGKCHALQRAGERARGEWLLFTDADVWMRADLVARAIAAAWAAGAGHVCILPRQGEARLSGKVAMLLFSLSLLEGFARVNRDWPGAFAGIGAFNLIRADLYRRIGGHQALRMEVVDDVRLGRLVRKAGGRTRGFLGAADAEVDYAPTAAAFVRVTEKNLFAYLRLRTGMVAVMLPLFLCVWLGALAGPWSGTLAGTCAGLALFSGVVPAALLARRIGWPVAPALLVPIGHGLMLPAVLNSMVKTLWRGGVRWRGTFHPLADLRRGMVR
jgi:glycosyltransferase involved in cell wall biosynthesis